MSESVREIERGRKERKGGWRSRFDGGSVFSFWANTKTRSHAKVTSENIFAKKNFDEF